MSDRPLVRRRTALAGLLGGLAAPLLVSGCDADDLRPPEDEEPTPSATTEPGAPSADETLVDEVLTALTAALAVLAQARTAPAIQEPVKLLLRAHRQHVEVLEGQLVHQAPPGQSPDPAVELLLVRRSERDLHATLVDAAGRAESGALARLLASMSASVTQHLAVLPVQA